MRFDLGVLKRMDDHRDLILAGGIMAIIAMLILPLPSWLLDLGLSLSITLSILILMAALFIEKPLDLSAFPTILLIATMLRLGLNVASTRLILAHGHEGAAAAGGVIAAFGEFLIGGDLVIGLTIFLILVVVNFVVITKGAGRIAEVAARFSLDSMPGKQMAIDADLSAGLIDEAEARARRREVEDESNFYGAMDGASKFVKGDAVAGLLITGINILVGLMVGLVSHDLALAEAGRVYTVLTVGDGLVSQIPALIVSTAAGLLVSKGGMQGKAGAALTSQLGRSPKAFAMAATLMSGLALLPGLPFAPFAFFGLVTGFLAWSSHRGIARRAADTKALEAARQAEAELAGEEEPIGRTLAIDAVRIELGYGLLPIISQGTSEPRLDDQVRALRRQLASDYGFVLPAVRITDNMLLKAHEYAVFIKETEVARGELRLDKLLVINPAGGPAGLAGEETHEPVFGLPAMWIDRTLRDEAGIRGLTVVDCGTVIATHLTELVRDNIADMLSYLEVQKLLTEVHRDCEKLVAELVPGRITISGVQRVLQNLLGEGISIRDLPTILEGLVEALGTTSNLAQVTEQVRSRLARQICVANSRDGAIPVVTLSPEWDAAFSDAILGEGDHRQLAMAPSRLQDFIAAVRSTWDRLAQSGEMPCLLVSPALRPFVRSIIERVRPATVVLSQNEIHAKARIRSLGTVGDAIALQ